VLPGHQGRDNNLAWHYDKHGVFSVKSAYKVARADFLRNKSTFGQQEEAIAILAVHGKISES